MIYLVLLTISIILTIIYAAMWHKHFNLYLTLIFSFIPFAELGYYFVANSTNKEEALTVLSFPFIFSGLLQMFITLTVFSLCKIDLKKIYKIIMFAVVIIVSSFTFNIKNTTYFYKGCEFKIVNGYGTLVSKDYGPLHTVFYVMIISFMVLGIGALIFGYIKKKDVSHSIIALLFLPELVSVVAYFGGKLLPGKTDLTPISYIFAQIVYLIIVYRLNLYNVDDTIIDSLVESGETGFISIDFNRRYLGSNETAKNLFPELVGYPLDKSIEKNEHLKETLGRWLRQFQNNRTGWNVTYEYEDKSYSVSVNYLYIGNRKWGYRFIFNDNTEDRNYIKLVDKYNSELETEVQKKTQSIVEMHDKMILSLAMMVESRDNSTGGHIMRTSEVVRILIEEMTRKNELHLKAKFCKDVIKAAPMHDLGKVAVDDAILRKPGRFTDEEYEKMKKHAEEGAKVIHKILDGTDDLEFHIIAENVAHYHHERMDGSGYPDGLKGEEIPLEARIMAIADVYDALVSKRVYKEKFSFEDADRIMMESMGKHFDKNLEKYYVAARPRFEEYYRSLDKETENEGSLSGKRSSQS